MRNLCPSPLHCEISIGHPLFWSVGQQIWLVCACWMSDSVSCQWIGPAILWQELTSRQTNTMRRVILGFSCSPCILEVDKCSEWNLRPRECKFIQHSMQIISGEQTSIARTSSFKIGCLSFKSNLYFYWFRAVTRFGNSVQKLWSTIMCICAMLQEVMKVNTYWRRLTSFEELDQLNVWCPRESSRRADANNCIESK